MLDTNIWIYIAKHQPPEVKAHFERLKPGSWSCRRLLTVNCIVERAKIASGLLPYGDL
jgi:predicted nucleic acid-binding protein